MGAVKLYENLYLHQVDDSLPEEAWEGTKTTFMVYIGRPGLAQYWEGRRGFFHQDFIRFVDSTAVPDMKSGAQMSKLDAPGPQ